MTEERPDADALLQSIMDHGRRESRGTLKIFFGMCAGVGKTYAMLEAAREAAARGVDVVVGYVETHGRLETNKLVLGLELIPRIPREYRGSTFTEFDLDAALARKPELILVDELAHTNVEGSRHERRFQDVEELLAAGISVYTTLNVQHLESRSDTVHQITGTVIKETVPDSIFESASEVELIDTPPDSLLKRLQEGKVYRPEKSAVAANHFFRVANLTALREMALRITAERVDRQVRGYLHGESVGGPWKSGERLLVAISAAPSSAPLIRWTRRMAGLMNAPWLALYVEGGKGLRPADDERLRLHMDLVRELGGEVQTVASPDIVQGMLDVARRENVTQIVIGKPEHRKWQLWRATLVDVLIDRSGNIDIHTVRVDGKAPDDSAVLPRSIFRNAGSYGAAIATVLVVAAAGFLIEPFVGYQSIGLILLCTMATMGLFLNRGPLVAAAVVSALAWNFMFIPPKFTFLISRPEDVILILMYLVVALVTGSLTARLRARASALRQREQRTALLFSIARTLSERSSVDNVIGTAVEELRRILSADVAVLLPNEDGILSVVHPASSFTPTEKDQSVASWSFTNNKNAGKFTATLASAESFCIPLAGSQKSHAVVCIRFGAVALNAELHSLIESALRLIGLALDREQLSEQASRTEVAIQSEKLRSTILSAVSHELRTPLAVVNAAVSTLRDPKFDVTHGQREIVLAELEIATTRLSRVVDHLLNMTRIESGQVAALRNWCDVRDLLLTVVKNSLPADREIVFDIPDNLPFIQADEGLLDQAITNILENAIKFTPAKTPIDIGVADDAEGMSITIRDHGPGVAEDVVDRLFEKFYRTPGVREGGTGLGLSIARGFIEAQGGKITSYNADGGGLALRIFLPLPRSTNPYSDQ